MPKIVFISAALIFSLIDFIIFAATFNQKYINQKHVIQVSEYASRSDKRNRISITQSDRFIKV